jgi:hypothetical protein
LGESEQRAYSQVVPVERHHRRTASHRLIHQAGSDEVLDHGARVARRDGCSSCELPSSDGLFQPRQHLQQRSANGRGHIENRCTEIHVSEPIRNSIRERII